MKRQRAIPRIPSVSSNKPNGVLGGTSRTRRDKVPHPMTATFIPTLPTNRQLVAPQILHPTPIPRGILVKVNDTIIVSVGALRMDRSHPMYALIDGKAQLAFTKDPSRGWRVKVADRIRVQNVIFFEEFNQGKERDTQRYIKAYIQGDLSLQNVPEYGELTAISYCIQVCMF